MVRNVLTANIVMEDLSMLILAMVRPILDVIVKVVALVRVLMWFKDCNGGPVDADSDNGTFQRNNSLPHLQMYKYVVFFFIYNFISI